MMSVLTIHLKMRLMILKKIKMGEKGSTLIEMLLYMGLLSILLVILTDIFISILDVRLESESTSQVEQDGRFILSRLSYDLNRAEAISSPANLGDTANSLLLTVGGVTYNYTLSGGNLQLNNGSTADNLNGSETNLSNITFQKLGNSGGKETVDIQFTINSVTQRAQGSESRTFQTTVGRR